MEQEELLGCPGYPEPRKKESLQLAGMRACIDGGWAGHPAAPSCPSCPAPVNHVLLNQSLLWAFPQLLAYESYNSDKVILSFLILSTSWVALRVN